VDSDIFKLSGVIYSSFFKQSSTHYFELYWNRQTVSHGISPSHGLSHHCTGRVYDFEQTVSAHLSLNQKRKKHIKNEKNKHTPNTARLHFIAFFFSLQFYKKIARKGR
jgi:hypothetical protein